MGERGRNPNEDWTCVSLTLVAIEDTRSISSEYLDLNATRRRNSNSCNVQLSVLLSHAMFLKRCVLKGQLQRQLNKPENDRSKMLCS